MLIGKPDTAEVGGSGKIETLLEQLRLRQLSIEQIETFERQVSSGREVETLQISAGPEPTCRPSSTNSLVQVRIAENEGEAALARARKQADQMVVTAQAESQQRALAGPRRGLEDPPGRSVGSVGLAPQDRVVRRPQALCPLPRRRVHVAQAARRWSPNAASSSPALPRKQRRRPRFGHSQGLLGLLVSLLVAEKSGFQIAETSEGSTLHEFAERMARQAMDSMQNAVNTNPEEANGSDNAEASQLTAPSTST